MDAMHAASAGRARRLRPVPLAVAAGAALLVLAAGAALVASRPSRYRAEAVLVVSPGIDVSTDAAAGYYETLSRGQILTTYAEVLRLSDFDDRTFDQLDLGRAERRGIDVTVEVIPETSLIVTSATAENADDAERVASRAAVIGAGDLRALDQPFEIELLGSADSSAVEEGGGALPILAAVAALALLAAIVAYRVALHLELIRAARRTATPVVLGAGDDEGVFVEAGTTS
jgi:hypothetical protein